MGIIKFQLQELRRSSDCIQNVNWYYGSIEVACWRINHILANVADGMNIPIKVTMSPMPGAISAK